MTAIIEMATVSSRGQICIPSDIREEMDIKEGSKVLFALMGDSLIMKKVGIGTFAEVTRPLKAAAKNAGLKEKSVSDMLHKFRKEKR